MSNQLVTPVFYIYKLTFKSGKTYIGSHKQTKERDTYITSSSYYLRHHNEDPLIKREILIEVESQYQMDFLETWCILSDKAYNKDNVNYNLGNFFHRFSNAFRTEEEKRVIVEKVKAGLAALSPEEKQRMVENCKKTMITKSPEEKQAAIEKRKKTWAAKSPEEKRAIVEKVKEAMAKKSSEELADIHYRQGRNKNGNTHKSEWWSSLSESEKEETKRKMSKAKSEWYANASDNQIEQFKQKCSDIRKAYFENMTDDDLNRYKQKCKIRELKRWENASEEERLKRCKGFYERHEERKQKVRCVETNDVFNSAKEAAAWIGPKAKGCNITAQARGRLHFAYRHPITNEPLHWELIN